jgi:hypothetical protein
MPSSELERKKSNDFGEEPVPVNAGDLSDVDIAETEKAAAPVAPEHDFPDGGPRAWAVAFGACFVLFCTLGYVNSFGYVFRVKT